MELESLFLKMIEYYSGDSRRIQHFIKVHSFSRRIGLSEGLDEKSLHILEVAAVVHDIGIKKAVEKYGSSTGTYQEQEGPPIARKMLEELGYAEDIIERVCYLVGHHHTYNQIDGLDYQILVEADFLVNIHEDNMSEESIQSLLKKIFKTKTGTNFCQIMFQVNK